MDLQSLNGMYNLGQSMTERLTPAAQGLSQPSELLQGAVGSKFPEEQRPDVERAYKFNEYMRSQSTELSLQTQDGDTVTFSFFNDYLKMNHSETISHKDYQQTATTEAEAYRTGLAFSVEGEIDEEERKAIEQVMTQIEDIANLFFSGAQPEAFEKALSLEFDTTELQSVNASFSQVEYQHAINQYESIENLAQPQAPSVPKSNDSSGGAQAALADYLTEILALLDEAFSQLPQLEQAVSDQTQTTDRLLDEFVKMLSGPVSKPLEPFYQNAKEVTQQVLKNTLTFEATTP